MPKKEQTPSTTSIRWKNRDFFLVLLLSLFALMIRVPLLQRGVDPNELALLPYWKLESLLTDGKTAIHPPLLRLMFSAPFDHSDSLLYGRWFSLICSIVVIPIAYAWGVLLGKHWSLGLTLAGSLAILPIAHNNAFCYGPYSFWILIAIWHGFALSRYVQNEENPSSLTFEIVFSAFLLPQIHYFSVPFLLCEGIALAIITNRRSLLFYVPAAIGILPFLWVVVQHPEQRIAPSSGNLMQALEWSFSLHLDSLMAPWIIFSHIMMLFWRKTGDKQTLLISLGCIGTIVSIIFVGSGHLLTPSVVSFFLVYPLAGTVLFARVIEYRGDIFVLRYGCTSFAVLSLFSLLQDRYQIYGDSPQQSMKQFAQEWNRQLPHDVQHVFITPNYMINTLRYYFTGTVYGESSPIPLCSNDGNCFIYKDVQFMGGDHHLLPTTRPLLVLYNDRHPPQNWPQGCMIQSQQPFQTVVLCR